MIKQIFLIESKGKKINKKGWVWLLAAVPAALAGLLLAWKSVTTPAVDPNSVSGIISSIPIWGWIIVGLVFLVLIMRR